MKFEPSGGYLHDILEQPQALEATHRSLEQEFDLKGLPRDLQNGKFRRIILTGMGSSHHVFYPLYYQLLQAGLPITQIETSELIHYAPALVQSDTLVIAASQSGRSAEILGLLDLAEQSHANLLGVTNTPGSPLDLRASARLMTSAGDEFTVSCKTYVAALLALRWLQDGLLGKELSRARAESFAIASAVKAYLEHWQEHVDTLLDEIHDFRTVFYAGRGPSLAAALTGGLTTEESAHFQAEGMSCAALRHGPVEMIGPGSFVMVFEGPISTRLLNISLANELAAAGATVGLVGNHHSHGVYSLPPVPESLLPILEILPVQMLTLALSQVQGHTAGEFERGSKVTIKE